MKVAEIRPRLRDFYNVKIPTGVRKSELLVMLENAMKGTEEAKTSSSSLSNDDAKLKVRKRLAEEFDIRPPPQTRSIVLHKMLADALTVKKGNMTPVRKKKHKEPSRPSSPVVHPSPRRISRDRHAASHHPPPLPHRNEVT